MDINIPDYEGLLFENRCIARTDFVTAKASELKLLYLRQVIKCQFNYSIELVVESKMEEVIYT